MKNIIIYIFICFLLSCAVKAPPPGGPIDNEKPYIVETLPVNGTSNLDLNHRVVITFNEMVNPNTIKSSIEIDPQVDLKISSLGKKVEIRPKYHWPDKDEFKIKIKRSISDYNGNYMNSGKVLTYNTKDEISGGIISGKLFNADSLNSYNIALYEVINDSLKMYYTIESDYNNNFKFNNIKNGEYVVIGLMNQIRNIYNDSKLFPYGLFYKKLILNDVNKIYDNVDIHISQPNKFESIVSMNMINNYYGEVLLTNDDKIFLIDKDNFNNNYLNFDNYVYFNNNIDSIYFQYNANNHISNYIIEGNYPFLSSINDTVAPKIITSYNIDNKNYIEFSEPVLIAKPSFYAIDELNDSIYFDYDYINPKTIVINNKEYDLISIKNNFIYDIDLNILIDNFIKFNLINKDSINTGNVYGEVIYNGDNEIIVEMININSGEKKRTFIDELNKFKLVNLYPDKYYIWAYENINSVSNQYFNGLLDPLMYASKFGVYDEMIQIRANWDIEGIKISIKDNK